MTEFKESYQPRINLVKEERGDMSAFECTGCR
jgi:hypothetical protein